MPPNSETTQKQNGGATLPIYNRLERKKPQKKIGRYRSVIEGPEIVTDIDEVMALLISMKNDNQSWQMIADKISTKHTTISAPLVRKVALGLCKSPKIEAALGLREETATVPLGMVRKNKPPKKWPARPGIFVSCSQKTKDLYSEKKPKGQTWGEWVADLVLLAEGIGEVV